MIPSTCAVTAAVCKRCHYAIASTCVLDVGLLDSRDSTAPAGGPHVRFSWSNRRRQDHRAVLTSMTRDGGTSA